MTKPGPAKLHILLARDAPYGVVIRRSPRKHSCTIGWDRKNDIFKIGQWVKDVINGQMCDISPDGKHLLIHIYSWRKSTNGGGGYTVLTKYPYLKGMGFYPHSDFSIGGLFVNNKSFWINNMNLCKTFRDPIDIKRLDCPLDDPYSNREYLTFKYSLRLRKEGWKYNSHNCKGFSKKLNKSWVLRKIVSYKGEANELYNLYTKETILVKDWDWADVDRNRLVWTSKGKLFAAEIQSDKIGETKELYDFNDMTFEPIVAPY